MSRLNIWIILLIISVLINGVLIGASARTWLASPEPAAVQQDRSAGPRGAFSMRTFVRALPDDKRADVRARFEAAGPELRELGRRPGGRASLRRDALRAEPLTPPRPAPQPPRPAPRAPAWRRAPKRSFLKRLPRWTRTPGLRSSTPLSPRVSGPGAGGAGTGCARARIPLGH